MSVRMRIQEVFKFNSERSNYTDKASKEWTPPFVHGQIFIDKNLYKSHDSLSKYIITYLFFWMSWIVVQTGNAHVSDNSWSMFIFHLYWQNNNR